MTGTGASAAARKPARHWRGSSGSPFGSDRAVMGEYERTSTAVLNAYIAPRTVTLTSENPERQARSAWVSAEPLLLIQSNGGAISVDQVAERPVTLLLSGPAAGVGALNTSQRAIGSDDLISMEIGARAATSLLMSEGAVAYTDSLDIGGYDVRHPLGRCPHHRCGRRHDRRVDRGACYRRARAAPARCRAPPATGGAARGDGHRCAGRARASLPGPIGRAARCARSRPGRARRSSGTSRTRSESTCEAAAAGIVRLMEQKLLARGAAARASSAATIPRTFTLVAAGGAGPMHGAAVGRQLGCRRVYVPRLAGAFCALGMLHADVRHDYVRIQLERPRPRPSRAEWRPSIASSRATRTPRWRARALPKRPCTLVRRSTCATSASSGTSRCPSSTTERRIARGFARTSKREHERRSAHRQPGGAIEITKLRIDRYGVLPPLRCRRAASADGRGPAADRARVSGSIPTRRADARRRLSRADLRPGHRIAGPASSTKHTTTVLVGAQADRSLDGWTPAGNVLSSRWPAEDMQ